jgi:hypothetical protein
LEIHGQTRIALDHLKEGRFSEAWSLASNLAHNNPENYWAIFTGTVSLLYLDDLAGFTDWLTHLQKIDHESAYTRYISALSSLIANDEEKAIYDWTRVIDDEQGWLAVEWLKRIKDSAIHKELILRKQYAEFIVYPGQSVFIPNIELPPEKNKRKKIFYYTASLICLLPVLLLFPFNSEEEISEIKNLSISEHASISKQAAAFQYKSAKKLKQDFSQAKSYLKNGKINQARILWNRVILSNADFKSIEKAKIFLRFIPQPIDESFNDNVLLKNILKDPALYTDCFLLWNGKLISEKYVEGGRIFKIQIEENSNSKLIQGFLANDSSNLVESLAKLRSKTSSFKEVAFLGQFKGEVGDNKDLYIELIKVWL